VVSDQEAAAWRDIKGDCPSWASGLAQFKSVHFLWSVLNGANLRVVWDNFICGFLVAGAMADLDHLMLGNIE
jgi:hypothetical protein